MNDLYPLLFLIGLISGRFIYYLFRRFIMFDINAVEKEAKDAIVKEKTERAKNALIKKLRDLDTARNVVRNIEREIEDLKASIGDGSFSG